MLNYRNFTISKKQSILKKYPDFVLVLEDEMGNDWYELQKNFEDDTLKILFDEDNRIVSYSFDVSTLTPTNLSIAEVSHQNLPSNFFSNITNYLFINEKIEPIMLKYEEKCMATESKKQVLLSEATNMIAPLQDAVELEIATDEEISLLKQWKKYRVFLNRINTSSELDNDWPHKPE
ncbi:tail fiber assembly protein [Providencia manganoxydans]|uniref:tail fiber assembly protein n=1 Tax=Providencia manganoxydans TaxID=2923283 RepID=UPI0034E59E57